MLNRKDQDLKNIIQTLQIYHDNVGEVDVQDDNIPSQKHILSELIEALGS